MRGSAAPTIFCALPPELAPLEGRLRSYYADNPAIEVLVDRRERPDRRRATGLRAALFVAPQETAALPPRERRSAERRAPQISLPPPRLPRSVRRHAGRVRFFGRTETPERSRHDADTHRLVLRIQAGDTRAFEELYKRYYDAVYRYARVALRDIHVAEDIAQQVFHAVLKAIPRYEVRESTPFRAWLFRIARNEVLMYRRREGIVEHEDPNALDTTGHDANGRRSNGRARRVNAHVTNGNGNGNGHAGPGVFEWVTDCDLIVLIKRLPDAQRQTIALRHLLGFSTHETAVSLERSAAAIRQLEHRALRYLEERLTALGRTPAEFGPPEYRRSQALARMGHAPVLGARRQSLTAALPSFAVAPSTVRYRYA